MSRDLAYSAVSLVGAASDQAGALDIVDEASHDGPVDDEAVGQRQLGGREPSSAARPHLSTPCCGRWRGLTAVLDVAEAAPSVIPRAVRRSSNSTYCSIVRDVVVPSGPGTENEYD